MTTPTIREIGKATESVLKFAAEAAEEHIDLCVFNGEDPDPEMCMGLWQSFQTTFPKESFAGDYDLAIWAFSAAYKNAVESLARAHKIAA